MVHTGHVKYDLLSYNQMVGPGCPLATGHSINFGAGSLYACEFDFPEANTELRLLEILTFDKGTSQHERIL